MRRTFTHTDEGVNINGTFISWEDFDKLEPSYHWNEDYPLRIYRVDKEVPSSIDPKSMLTQGTHVLIEPNGTRHNQELPSKILDDICSKLSEYKEKLELWNKEKEQVDYRKKIDDFKNFLRKNSVGAKTAEQKQELESILQEMDDKWGSNIAVSMLSLKLQKYYGLDESVKE